MHTFGPVVLHATAGRRSPLRGLGERLTRWSPRDEFEFAGLHAQRPGNELLGSRVDVSIAGQGPSRPIGREYGPGVGVEFHARDGVQPCPLQTYVKATRSGEERKHLPHGPGSG